MKIIQWSTILLFIIILHSCISPTQTTPPAPYGAIPTKEQTDWQQLEYYMFVHFGTNTFSNVEWGDGKEDPKIFNPSGVDCRQWAATAKAAGMKGIIITAKHHDGFCLWQSNFSTHTVRESAWKDGKGDLLQELSDACREFGLKFGVYLSPWDRNHPAYGTPDYNQVFANTLNEVLSSYGEVFEQWFDGANGEGHEGKKQVYDWELFHKTVYRNQPHAIIFSDVGPGCRWMGNEQGVAGETNWATMNTEGFEPGSGAPDPSVLNTGEQGGKAWVPAEVDVSIRPGWFYSPATDDKVKTVEKLMDIYYTSVGRNANLLLNVPPDRRGRIHPNDSTRLMEFRKAREMAFANDLSAKADIKASNTRANSAEYSVGNILDNDYNTYWAVDDDTLMASIEIDLKEAQTFNRLLLQEYIPLGQRITAVSVEYMDAVAQTWRELTRATTVGYKRILRFPAVTAQKVRIEFTAAACPVVSAIGIYRSPEQLATPAIARSMAGVVSIECDTPDAAIFYTIDNSEPSETSKKYTGAFPLRDGGTVKAIAIADNANRSETVTARFDIAPEGWNIILPHGDDVKNMIDGDVHTSAKAKINSFITIDLAQSYMLNGFCYVPLADVQAANMYRYDLEVSVDNNNWMQVAVNAAFDNIANNPVEQAVRFDKPVEARIIKITPRESVTGSSECVIAEVGIITR
ncbi:MAG: alpha-L-fucosidase [Cytophagaceae bacterium]|nr:alpha-L-fucosidase [Cytophagaceae bacterium]